MIKTARVHHPIPTGKDGFTLIELLITMFISLLLLASVYSAYISQQKKQAAQDQVVQMQQHLRGALNYITRELRMAGLDPQGNSGAGISQASGATITFTMDRNDNETDPPGDGDTTDTDEEVTYSLLLGADNDNDGMVDAGFTDEATGTTGSASLCRTANGLEQPLADSIEAIEFLYLLGSDPDDLKPTLSPADGELNNIHSVVISILARARFPDRDFINHQTYLPASADPSLHDGAYYLDASQALWGNPDGDNFRRRLLISTVQLRNMNL